MDHSAEFGVEERRLDRSAAAAVRRHSVKFGESATVNPGYGEFRQHILPGGHSAAELRKGPKRRKIDDDSHGHSSQPDDTRTDDGDPLAAGRDADFETLGDNNSYPFDNQTQGMFKIFNANTAAPKRHS